MFQLNKYLSINNCKENIYNHLYMTNISFNFDKSNKVISKLSNMFKKDNNIQRDMRSSMNFNINMFHFNRMYKLWEIFNKLNKKYGMQYKLKQKYQHIYLKDIMQILHILHFKENQNYKISNMFNLNMLDISLHTSDKHYLENQDKINQGMNLDIMSYTNNNQINKRDNQLVKRNKQYNLVHIINKLDRYYFHNIHLDNQNYIMYLINIYPSKINMYLLNFNNFSMDMYNFHN